MPVWPPCSRAAVPPRTGRVPRRDTCSPGGPKAAPTLVGEQSQPRQGTAEAAGITARLLGGAAVAISAPAPLPAPLLTHPVSDGGPGIDAGRLAKITGSD
jgi:hypothetical protein